MGTSALLICLQIPVIPTGLAKLSFEAKKFPLTGVSQSPVLFNVLINSQATTSSQSNQVCKFREKFVLILYVRPDTGRTSNSKAAPSARTRTPRRAPHPPPAPGPPGYLLASDGLPTSLRCPRRNRRLRVSPAQPSPAAGLPQPGLCQNSSRGAGGTDARSLTWNYDTLHPRLKLSDDSLVVSRSWRRIFYPCGPQRFDKSWQVLSRDAYLSGSHYWEADLEHAGAGWWIGTAQTSIGRKADSETCRLGWNRASWCLKKSDFEYCVFHKGNRIPILIDDPDCIGIFLDYEARILSFYNVTDGMAHLHTLCCKFTDPAYPALRLWEGSIAIHKLT
ncbi:LOW QUALITY PROTEIN: tripartite motif-containing protein 14-like [Phaethornis superciliosus]